MPYTVNRSLNVPNTGDMPGAWGTTAINNNMSALDGQMGGVVTVSLTNANVTLTAGTGTITPSAGPSQSDNAVVKFSGSLSGNCVVTFPYTGFYIVENGCTVGAFYVQTRAAGTGNVLGLPPGEPCHVYNDGTNMKFVNMGRVGSYMDLAVSTTPPWMPACSVRPYLACDGAVHTASSFTALFAMLGSTFGGNGITTFGVPDLVSRIRLPVDTNGSGRITTGGSGIDGTVLGAGGGSQLLQQHTHTVTDIGHTHPISSESNVAGAAGLTKSALAPLSTFASNNATTGITINNAGTGTGGNVPPALVAGIAFIKT